MTALELFAHLLAGVIGMALGAILAPLAWQAVRRSQRGWPKSYEFPWGTTPHMPFIKGKQYYS